jgi:hypothetical protein
MAVCDYCGTTYRGGAAVHGKLRFCTHQCRDRGRVLELLDDVPPSIIDRRVEEVRAGPCSECGAQANVDFHKSHRIWSALFYTTWKTRTHFCCQGCGRRHQMKDAAFSGLLGWWMPLGFFITPFQVVRNIKGMMRRGDQASGDLVRSVKVAMARSMAAEPASGRHEA